MGLQSAQVLGPHASKSKKRYEVRGLVKKRAAQAVLIQVLSSILTKATSKWRTDFHPSK